MKRTVALVSGGFDPIHSGHIEYFKAARALADILVVAVNSDDWLVRKKGAAFMPVQERVDIVRAIGYVDRVITFDDTDNTAKDAIIKVREHYPDYTIVFANGGDRTKENIPEMDVDVQNLEFVFGVGGQDKKNSSSWILKNWKYPHESRVWGSFSNLFQDEVVKVKELVIAPKSGISYQRHFKRNEIWYVSKGECHVKSSETTPEEFVVRTMQAGDSPILIPQLSWHQVYNTTDHPCHIIEIQYGEETNENDIERLEYYNE
jgi:cytidyltransferase-like protein